MDALRKIDNHITVHAGRYMIIAPILAALTLIAYLGMTSIEYRHPGAITDVDQVLSYYKPFMWASVSIGAFLGLTGAWKAYKAYSTGMHHVRCAQGTDAVKEIDISSDDQGIEEESLTEIKITPSRTKKMSFDQRHRGKLYLLSVVAAVLPVILALSYLFLMSEGYHGRLENLQDVNEWFNNKIGEVAGVAAAVAIISLLGIYYIAKRAKLMAKAIDYGRNVRSTYGYKGIKEA